MRASNAQYTRLSDTARALTGTERVERKKGSRGEQQPRFTALLYLFLGTPGDLLANEPAWDTRVERWEQEVQRQAEGRDLEKNVVESVRCGLQESAMRVKVV